MGTGCCKGKGYPDMAFFTRPWLKALLRGDRPLWEAWWIFGAGTTVVLKGGLYIFIRLSRGEAGAGIFLLGTALLFAQAFAVFSVWKCAPNTDNRIWFHLARLWAILVPIAAAWSMIAS